MSNSVTDKKFKISIIMSVYNVEDYLEEAISSIVNQTIGIDNIQLILVNDGSVDNSEDICLKFQDEYPDNIFYYKKKNGGLSSAKNCGLKYVKGELVNFFDSDDTLPLNTLESVYKFYKKHENSIDVLTLPLVFFEAKTGLHPKYNYMGDKNRIINLLDEPYNFFLSGAASFYKLEAVKDFSFDESFRGEEDSLLNMSLLLKNPRFGYICENGVRYNYRKRFTQNSIVDTAKFDPETYRTVIKLLDRTIPKGNLYDYHKEFIAYELGSRIFTIDKKLFDENDFNNIIDKYREYVKKLDADFIIHRSVFIETGYRKISFLKLAGYENEIRNVVLFNNIFNLRKIKYNDGKVFLFISYNNYGCSELRFGAQINNKIVYPTVDKDFNGCFDRKKYDELIDKSHFCIFEFNTTNKRIQFGFVDKNGYFYPATKVYTGKYCLLRNVLRRVRYKGVSVSLTNNIVTIKKEKYNIINEFIDFLKILIKRRHFAFLRLLCRDNKKYILINDRLSIARDNGEALFKYINKYDKELAKKTYYVISKESDDYNRLKKIGKVVSTGSLKHKFLYLNSQYIYSSHMLPDFYSAFSNSNRKYYYDLCQYDFVWLQHGITQNDISGAANYLLKANDYVIAVTRSEYEEFTKDKYCYDNSQILLTGFARYDLLENDEKNIITISPTWRTWLTDLEKEDFLDSDYYKNYSNLLKDKGLSKKLKSKNITLQFILHPEMLPFIDEFMKYENDTIKIISKPNYNEIFNTSKLLITDYSSVFFDFAYLKKPIIYFQFDQDDFYTKHYKQGYFSCENDGFGDVLDNYKSVVDKINYYIDNGFKSEKKYIDRIEKTFVFLDKNNSKRILDSTYYKNK